MPDDGAVVPLAQVWPHFYGLAGTEPPSFCSSLSFLYTSNCGPRVTSIDPKFSSVIIKFFSIKNRREDWLLKEDDESFRHLLVVTCNRATKALRIIAGLSLTIHDQFLFLRRLIVTKGHQRKRLATFLVAAAQSLFCRHQVNIAVEIRHPVTKTQYAQALKNSYYRFYVHGLHFQPTSNNDRSPLNRHGLFERILANREELYNLTRNSAGSNPHNHRAYYCHWRVSEVLPDASLLPWQMFDRLFSYSYSAFNVWQSSCETCPLQPPCSEEFLQQLSTKCMSIPPVDDLPTDETDSSNNNYDLDLINSILRSKLNTHWLQHQSRRPRCRVPALLFPRF